MNKIDTGVYGRGHKKCSNDDLISCYAKTGNIHKVAKEFSMCSQSVHERLIRLGVETSINRFSKEDREYLKVKYSEYRNAGKLSELAALMGRSKQFICRQAGNLGLTDQKLNKEWLIKEDSDPYARYHARVRASMGKPKKCDVCGKDEPKKWYDWANLTGDYNNINDYKRMCRPCHRAYDRFKRYGKEPATMIMATWQENGGIG